MDSYLDGVVFLSVALAAFVGIYGILRERKLSDERALEAEQDGWIKGQEEMADFVVKMRVERAMSTMNNVTISAEMVGGRVMECSASWIRIGIIRGQ